MDNDQRTNRYKPNYTPEQESARVTEYVLLCLQGKFILRADMDKIIDALNECLRKKETISGPEPIK